jgi:hypothetical protein
MSMTRDTQLVDGLSAVWQIETSSRAVRSGL